MNNSYPRIVFFFIGLVAFALYANRAPVNILIPYDQYIVPLSLFQDQRCQFSLYGEGGLKNAKGLNVHGDSVNPLRIWNELENVITMLDGAPENSLAAELRKIIPDGQTIYSGKVEFSGNYKEHFAGVFAVKGTVCPYFFLSLYLPFFSYSLQDTAFHDLTGNDLPSDRLIKQLITDHLAETVKKLGDLDLSPWSRSGTGDVTIEIAWNRHFKQQRPLLKEVSSYIHVGVSLPTARRANPNKLLDFSFGNNGAFAIPFGAALDLAYGSYLHCGLDILLIHTFAHVETRRIKTAQNQTELLLLQSAEVYVDYGLTQRFYLYGALQNFIPHVTASFGYHFEKQGEDTVYVRGNQFQSSIAQDTQVFDDRTMHQMIATLEYDASFKTSELVLSLVLRVPFNGKRVIVSSTLGASISFAF